MRRQGFSWAGAFALAGSVVLVSAVVLTTSVEDADAKPPKAKAKPKGKPAAAAPTTPPQIGTAAKPSDPDRKYKVLPGKGCGSTPFRSAPSSSSDDPHPPEHECGSETTDVCCRVDSANGYSADCVDFKRDWRNCGGCGLKCLASEACVDGLCACTKGQIRCNGKCIDPKEDGVNCGQCGNKCAQMCSGGQCKTCTELGLGSYCGTADSGHCAKLQTSDTDCGKCDHSCPDSWRCSKGKCVP